MATSGAYSGQSFSFNYSFVDSATPTQFFASDLATSDITVYSRTGSTTGAGANIASAPTRIGTLFTFTLSTLEMVGDEVIVQVTASGMVPETISIALQPTPSDISEVTQSAVSGISDFHGSGGGGGAAGPTEAEIYTYFTSASREDAFKATGFNTVAPDNASIAAILTDTNELQSNQNNWLTATGFSTHSATDVRNALQAVAGDFKATGFATVNPDNASISAILADTNELQQNQGDWATATGFSTFDHNTDQVVASNMRGTDGAVTTDAPTAADVYSYFTAGNREDVFKASGFATVNPDNSSIASILADTNELQQNQNNWLTATGFSTHSATDVRNALQAVAGDFKATGFSTFNPASDSVTVGTNNDKSGYALSQSFPANFSDLIIGTGGDAGKVTTSNPAAGSGSSHTAADVANLILDNPANKLVTDSSGRVTAENMRGTDGANTVAPDNASISAILADTNELQGNQGDWATATGFSTHSAADVRNSLQAVANDFKANVSGLASQSSVNTLDNNVDAVKAKTDQLNFTNPGEVDANAVSGGSSGGGGDDAATIYSYFVNGSREDAFKADVSGLSTFDASSETVTTDTASRNASKANVSGLSTFDPASQTVTTDTASREASKANVSGLATSSDISALNNFDASSEDVTISTAQAQAIADEVLKRSVANTQDSADAHSLAAIVLCMLESQRSGASWTIRKTDGSTFATKTLSLDGSATPVVGVD